jgi:glycine C-acetyltransferase
MDLFDKCKTDEGYFGPFRSRGDHFFTRPILDPLPGNRMQFQGEEVIMWSVNNYLGLANHPDIKKAAEEALDTYSVSAPMGSRMMSGNTQYHLDLEAKLADYAQKESAFLFNYGYLGVLGTIASLVGQDDIIIMDKLAHASIVDGVLLSRGQFRVYRHNDMDSLEKVLKRSHRNRKGGVLIVTEGTFGMTGDLAKLEEICELKEEYDARLFIDDAHGIGVMGEKGRGAADYLGVQDKIDIYFGTFAKAFAAIGGYSASSRKVVEWIQYNARTQVFAKSLPMVYVKALEKALELVINGDENRKKMWENSAKLKQGLRELGYYIGPGESPICAVFAPIGENDLNEIGEKMVGTLRERGIFVTGVVYPVIPLGLCMFRMIPTTAHTDEDIEKTVEAFRSLRDDIGLDLTMSAKDKANIGKIYVDEKEKN